MKEILLTILPAVLVLITAYIMLDKLLKDKIAKRKEETKAAEKAIILPIRLRAYERLILVLERTKPSNLVLNTIKVNMTTLELQTELLNQIHKEFDHNLSQQIYVSQELWSKITSAQNSLLQLINVCASTCNAANNATELAETIIMTYAQQEKSETEIACELLKKELTTIFE